MGTRGDDFGTWGAAWETMGAAGRTHGGSGFCFWQFGVWDSISYMSALFSASFAGYFLYQLLNQNDNRVAIKARFLFESNAKKNRCLMIRGSISLVFRSLGTCLKIEGFSKQMHYYWMAVVIYPFFGASNA